MVFPPQAHTEVFFAKDEALELAFPQADQVETRTFILTDEQRLRAQKLARTKIESNLFTFFVGKKSGKIVGYAAIDSHNVRTHPETFMTVLTAEGKIKTTVILAFHEPKEYLPPDRWLAQFQEKDRRATLRPGDDVAGILGSTLSVRALSGGVRKVLALHYVLIENDSH